MTTVLVSTLNNDKELIDKMNIKGKCVVVNQNSKVNTLKKINDGLLNEKVWIDSTEIGLSKSRNLAIRNSNSNISIIADDDLIYLDDYDQVVSDAHKKYHNYDVIAFKVLSKGFEFKDYPENKQKIGFLRSMRISSVQITFKTEKVRNKIVFNEKFGSGSDYSMGEENIFLYECLRNGLKILYLPITIAELTFRESTWFEGYNEKYLIDRGASYYAMSKYFYPFLILQFAIRKYKIFSENGIYFLKSVKLMFNGVENYKELLKR